MNDIAEVKQNQMIGISTDAGFGLLQRVAKMFASCDLVPKEYKNNLSNCCVAISLANRIGADILMVMQNLYIIHGKPGWSAQFMISAFNLCGKFSSVRYEFFGEEGKDDWGCRAWAIEKETGDKMTGARVTIGLAKKEGWYSKTGSKWQTMPQQMLMYRAASWFIRAYAPEITMGLHTKDEIEDYIDGEVVKSESNPNIINTATKVLEDIKNTLDLSAVELTGQNCADEQQKVEALR